MPFVAPDAGRDFFRNGQRSNLLKALTDQTRPIVNSIAHKATVDVIEFLMIYPSFLHIIDLKAYIGRHPVSFGRIS